MYTASYMYIHAESKIMSVHTGSKIQAVRMSVPVPEPKAVKERGCPYQFQNALAPFSGINLIMASLWPALFSAWMLDVSVVGDESRAFDVRLNDSVRSPFCTRRKLDPRRRSPSSLLCVIEFSLLVCAVNLVCSQVQVSA